MVVKVGHIPFTWEKEYYERRKRICLRLQRPSGLLLRERWEMGRLSFFKFTYFDREGERERENMSRGGAEREGQRESQAGSGLFAWSLTRGLNSWTPKSSPEMKPRVVHLTDWAIQVPQDMGRLWICEVERRKEYPNWGRDDRRMIWRWRHMASMNLGRTQHSNGLSPWWWKGRGGFKVTFLPQRVDGATRGGWHQCGWGARMSYRNEQHCERARENGLVDYWIN